MDDIFIIMRRRGFVKARWDGSKVTFWDSRENPTDGLALYGVSGEYFACLKEHLLENAIPVFTITIP